MSSTKVGAPVSREQVLKLARFIEIKLRVLRMVGEGVPPVGVPPRCLDCGKVIQPGEKWTATRSVTMTVVQHDLCRR